MTTMPLSRDKYTDIILQWTDTAVAVVVEVVLTEVVAVAADMV